MPKYQIDALSVFFPAYNEETNLPVTVAKAVATPCEQCECVGLVASAGSARNLATSNVFKGLDGATLGFS